MSDATKVTIFVFVLLAGQALGGGYMLFLGIKGGIVDRRVKRGGRVYEGEDAIRVGIIWIALGVMFWGFAWLTWWVWATGRITLY